MKPIQLIAGLGVVLIVALGGWYFYMQKTPPYETATERGFNPATAKPATPATPASAKATPGDTAP